MVSAVIAAFLYLRIDRAMYLAGGPDGDDRAEPAIARAVRVGAGRPGIAIGALRAASPSASGIVPQTAGRRWPSTATPDPRSSRRRSDAEPPAGHRRSPPPPLHAPVHDRCPSSLAARSQRLVTAPDPARFRGDTRRSLGSANDVRTPISCASTSRSPSWAASALALIGILLGVVGRILRPDRPQAQKYLTYESGVDPVGAGWSQSQVRYYIFALLFVMFDVEAVFIFPWATRLEAYGTFGLVEMVVFIVDPRPRPGLRLAQEGLRWARWVSSRAARCPSRSPSC